jgi:methylated-DNA-[protein]-cysteine S-methyltransferase
MLYNIFDSPIGKFTVATDGSHITALHIEGDRYFKEIPREWKREPDNQLLQKAHQELDEYFAGKRTDFDLPISSDGTVFQKAVWKSLQSVPNGKTTTYSEIARKIGKPQTVRAVGTAIGHNPICIIVPCHRVVASDGSLGGYVAGLQRKQKLLNIENPGLLLKE